VETANANHVQRVKNVPLPTLRLLIAQLISSQLLILPHALNVLLVSLAQPRSSVISLPVP